MSPQNIASTAQDKPRRSSEVEPVHRPGVYIMSRAINDPNTAHEIRRNKVQRPAAIKKVRSREEEERIRNSPFYGHMSQRRNIGGSAGFSVSISREMRRFCRLHGQWGRWLCVFRGVIKAS